jgi:hypothetical protein
MISQAEFRSNQLVLTHLVTGISSGWSGIFRTRHTGFGVCPLTLLCSGYRDISGDKEAWAYNPLGAFLVCYRLKFAADISFGVYSVSAAFGKCSPIQRGSMHRTYGPCNFAFFFQINFYTFFHHHDKETREEKITRD